jgi:uncharacterized protein (TIGR00369 family)
MSSPTEIAARIGASFDKQSFMALLGVKLQRVEEGLVELSFERHDTLLQQHGLVHAGVVSAVLDSACGYAALTRMRDNVGVLSVNFTTNLLAPAAGTRFLVRASVVRSGRTISVCRGEAWCTDSAEHRLIAAMQATMMSVEGRAGVQD